MMTISDSSKQMETTPVKAKTVVLWGREELLVEAVEHLLVHKDWQVLRVSTDWDAATLLHHMKDVTPDVLIVSESVVTSDGELLIQVVETYPCLKIITINLDNNLIGIYHKQTLGIKEASDLFEIIEAVDLNTKGGKSTPRAEVSTTSLQLID